MHGILIRRTLVVGFVEQLEAPLLIIKLLIYALCRRRYIRNVLTIIVFDLRIVGESQVLFGDGVCALCTRVFEGLNIVAFHALGGRRMP